MSLLGSGDRLLVGALFLACGGAAYLGLPGLDFLDETSVYVMCGGGATLLGSGMLRMSNKRQRLTTRAATHELSGTKK